MWIPNALYHRLPLIYSSSGVACLLLFELEIVSLVSASCLFASAQLTDVWRRRHSAQPDLFTTSCDTGGKAQEHSDPSHLRSAAELAQEQKQVAATSAAVAAAVVGVRFPAKSWSAVFVNSLNKQPDAAELMPLCLLLRSFMARSPRLAARELACQLATTLARALLGSGEYRGCLASRLPVYRLAGEGQLPRLCTDGELRLLLSAVDAPDFDATGALATLAIHRSAAALAFRLPP